MDKYFELLRENNHSEIERYFIGNDVNDEIAGGTPLMWAVRQNNIEFVKRLIELGADPNKVDDVGRSPLEIACYYGFLEVAEVLLQKGAKVDFNCFRRAECSWYGSSQRELIELLKRWDLA
ncbi:ankyrin repeat domain-containing protein [Bacillus sp. FJAT-49711]|uniref:ankyrin repeat domain-containing protein n=1 Tax=Bacillus sp. FJAT-49711 TaxID=2833585 RepID=UPI001BC93F91|nr:ankyrin repeat domain-containing protein [Bacillus sp. FJAT-49711]MBS4220074.1 ankyrin repeat domain-containing protein [Bacillus sp. FJAT-49711]